MKNTNYVLVAAGANTAGEKDSAKVDCQQLFAASFIATFSDAAAAGTLKIQGSNDPCPYSNVAADFTPTNWADIPSASVVVASGATSTVQISQICYRWIRAAWTRSAGAGTFTVYLNAMGN